MNGESNGGNSEQKSDYQKRAFLLQSEPEPNLRLESKGLVMNLIDIRKLSYDEIKKALEITKNQINTILKHNHKTEENSQEYLKNELERSNLLLKILTEYRDGILEERSKVMKALEVFVDFEIKYRNKNTTVKEEIERLTIDMGEVKRDVAKLKDQIKAKSIDIEQFIKEIDQNLFNQVEYCLKQNSKFVLRLQEIFIGIFKNRETGNFETVQSAYSSFYNFIKLITIENLEIHPKIFIQNVYTNIQEMEEQILKEEDIKNVEEKIIIEKFITIIKIYCEYSTLQKTLQDMPQFQLLNVEENPLKKKKNIFDKSKLLADEIICFNSLLKILDTNISRKYNEIEQINELIKSIPSKYRNEMQISISEFDIKELYQQSEILREVDIPQNL